MTSNTLLQAAIPASVMHPRDRIATRQTTAEDGYWFSSRLIALLIFTLMLFGLYGCSSTSSDVTGTSDESTLVIGLTDAQGDFLNYTVDVVSLKMLKSNGAEVETLPLTTKLDFSQYVEVTEFLTAATVPSGHYTGAKIVLDYSDAEITVQDENGDPINATVEDSDGNPITQLTVDVTFNGESDFVIAPGIPANITLDFDLDASNTIVINGAEATVVVSPILVADTILEEPKPHRLRGVLASVDVAENQFSISMRPFRHRNQSGFGQLDVHVSADTSYEIDGEVIGSDEGLNQMALLEPATAVIVLGILDVDLRQFNALEVYAGTSVPWGEKDIVTGNVISRTGNDLLVRGATIVRADGSFIFNDNVTITLSDTTTVVKQADANETHTISELSVGQRITVIGTITDTVNINLDADHVRMLFTNLSGTVVSASPLAVALQLIDSRRIVLFDFAGTGADALSDADPDSYDVDTGVLTLDNIQPGDVIKVRGFVSEFAMAPEDFIAQTVVDASNVRSHMVVGYGTGSVDAISSLNETGMVLNLDEAGLRHYINRAGIFTDLQTLDSDPEIKPRETGSGLFVISSGSGVRVYTDYAGFVAALTERLDGSTKVLSVHASGSYDSDLNALSSSKINIRLSKEVL